MNSRPLSESMPSSGKGQAAAHVQQRREGPPSGAVAHARAPRSSRWRRRCAERVGELTARIAALVGDQVDLEEAGPGLVPLGVGAHRDLALQQAARLGEAAALEAQAAALGRQPIASSSGEDLVGWESAPAVRLLRDPAGAGLQSAAGLARRRAGRRGGKPKTVGVRRRGRGRARLHGARGCRRRRSWGHLGVGLSPLRVRVPPCNRQRLDGRQDGDFAG